MTCKGFPARWQTSVRRVLQQPAKNGPCVAELARCRPVACIALMVAVMPTTEFADAETAHITKPDLRRLACPMPYREGDRGPVRHHDKPGRLASCAHARGQNLTQSQRSPSGPAGDVGKSFATSSAERMASASPPWAEWKHGRPLTQKQLGGLLRPFGIVSETVSIPGFNAGRRQPGRFPMTHNLTSHAR